MARILFVDDEAGIRETLPPILRLHGHNVTAAEDVKTALQLVNAQQFDILLTDLNIGQPGDGFTVVSAMRRVQPQVVNIILTGFPAFESALQAIRSQVDDYVVKPASVESLLQLIEAKAKQPHEPPLPLKRVHEIIWENKEQIIEEWFLAVNNDQELGRVSLDDEQRKNNLPELLQEIVHRISSTPGKSTDRALRAAAVHGAVRREQDYTIPMMIREAKLLQEVIGKLVQHELLSVNISFVIQDLLEMASTVEGLLEEAVRSFLIVSCEAA
jgi:YesN/AraC family two-component response regulator